MCYNAAGTTHACLCHCNRRCATTCCTLTKDGAGGAAHLHHKQCTWCSLLYATSICKMAYMNHFVSPEPRR